MTPEQVAQFYLDKQGYIVVASFFERAKGEVIQAVAYQANHGGPSEHFEHKLVVVGPATKKDYIAQCKLLNGSSEWAERPCFHKVTAE